jgi:hypothetical protein
VTDSGKAEVLSSTLINGRTIEGSSGCVGAIDNATVRFVNTLISSCRTPLGGGGIGMADRSRLELINSTVTNNTAGRGGAIDAGTNVHGGGVALWNSASMLLESSELHSNYAHYAGGGMHVSDRTTVVFKGDKKSVVQNNEAGTTGGGIRLASGLAGKTLSDFLVVDGNKVSNQTSDISVTATSIQIESSNADNLVASDSREGFLQLALNVSGRNGMPSDDKLTSSLYDANNVKLYDQVVVTQGTELKQAAISIKRPPGRNAALTRPSATVTP